MEIGPLVSRSVVTVGPDHSLAEAARKMVGARVGSAVVAGDQEGPPGIISERDILRATADGADLEKTRVETYMTANAITASSGWDVRAAAARMLDGGFRHLIVLDEGGGIAGMLSIRDLVGSLLEELGSGSRAGG